MSQKFNSTASYLRRDIEMHELICRYSMSRCLYPIGLSGMRHTADKDSGFTVQPPWDYTALWAIFVAFLSDFNPQHILRKLNSCFFTKRLELLQIEAAFDHAESRYVLSTPNMWSIICRARFPIHFGRIAYETRWAFRGLDVFNPSICCI
jgi:hypothetical protein